MSNFRLETTADGSITFFSEEFGELFHSHFGAYQEAESKYVAVTRLRDRAQTATELCLLDVCYGLGYNTAAALTAIWAVNPQCRVTCYALELDRRVPETAIAHQLLQPWAADVVQDLTTLATQGSVNHDRLHAQLLIGDARQTIHHLQALNIQADAIFLDPFSPPNCPQLWTVEFLTQVAHCLASGGYLATYSCAAAVRSALLATGLSIGSTSPVGRRTPGTVARWCDQDVQQLLPHELEHLQTRAAVPFRDLTGVDSAAVIHDRRAAEQARSSLEATSHWKKRWSAIRKYEQFDFT